MERHHAKWITYSGGSQYDQVLPRTNGLSSPGCFTTAPPFARDINHFRPTCPTPDHPKNQTSDGKRWHQSGWDHVSNTATSSLQGYYFSPIQEFKETVTTSSTDARDLSARIVQPRVKRN
mmetsp:Transcript_1207/g.1757  ORF Transcript_1207/g.1757 Transcript_1207/m.1757 type:complete len:120 (-) Transcript_1207:222-581(-)